MQIKNKGITKKKLYIIGSGSDELIKENTSDHIYVNTSFSRLSSKNNEYKINTLYMSEGYCNPSDILNAKPIKDMSAEDSLRFRKKKINFLSKVKTENLFVVTNIDSDIFKNGCNQLDLTYKNIRLISIREFYLYCIKLIYSSKNINFTLLFFWILAVIFNKKPRPNLRPSTGMIAMIMSAVNSKKIHFELDGMMVRSTITNPHSFTDKYVFDCLKSMHRISFVNKELNKND